MSPSSRTLALLKRITIATVPPVCVHVARSVLRAARSVRVVSSLPEWEYVPEGWPCFRRSIPSRGDRECASLPGNTPIRAAARL